MTPTEKTDSPALPVFGKLQVQTTNSAKDETGVTTVPFSQEFSDLEIADVSIPSTQDALQFLDKGHQSSSSLIATADVPVLTSDFEIDMVETGQQSTMFGPLRDEQVGLQLEMDDTLVEDGESEIEIGQNDINFADKNFVEKNETSTQQTGRQTAETDVAVLHTRSDQAPIETPDDKLASEIVQAVQSDKIDPKVLGGTSVASVGQQLFKKSGTDPAATRQVSGEIDPDGNEQIKFTSDAPKKQTLEQIERPGASQTDLTQLGARTERPAEASSSSIEVANRTTYNSAAATNTSTPATQFVSTIIEEPLLDVALEDTSAVRSVDHVTSRDRPFVPTSLGQNPLLLNANSARQILGQISASLNQAVDGSIEIRLNPAELGRITIQIAEGSLGQLASVLVEKPEVLDLLRRNEQLLDNEFQDAGFGSLSFSFNQQDSSEFGEKPEGTAEETRKTDVVKTAFVQAPNYLSRVDLDIRM